LAVRVLGVSRCRILAGEGAEPAVVAEAAARAAAPKGNQAERRIMPAVDGSGRRLGALEIESAAPGGFPADSADILAGLARQAAALLALDPGQARRDSRVSRESAEPGTDRVDIASHFRIFLDHLPSTAFIKDGNHRYVFVNRAFWKLYNGTGEEGDPLDVDETRRLTPDSVEKVRLADRQVLETGEKLERIEKLEYDGGEHTWWVCKFPIPGEDGRRLVGGITLDISELDKAQAETRLFDSVFRNIGVGVAIWKLEDPADPGGFRMIAANAAALRMTGAKARESVGRSIREFPEMLADGYGEIFRRVLESGKGEDLGEVRYGAARSGPGPFSTKVFPLPEQCVGVAFENVSEQKKAQESLRRSVERFELISRATNDALWELDCATGEVWWNERLYALLGYDPSQDRPGMEAWEERLHPEDRECTVESMRGDIEGDGDHWVREYRIRRADGAILSIYSRGYISRDAQGRARRVLAAMMDITGLKRAQESALENEERYRKLVELLPDAVAISIDGILEFINRAGVAFRGVERAEDMVGTPVLDFFHPDDRPLVAERQKRLASGEPVPPIQFRLLRADGSILEAESRAIPFPYRGRNANLVVIRDVTERLRAEEALRRSEEHYRLLFHESPQPMYLVDLDNLRFLDVNRAAEVQYGYSREEFLAMSLRGIRPQEDIPYLAEKVRGIRTGRGNLGVWRHRRKDGSQLQAEVIAHPLEDAGEPAAALVIATDVTEKLKVLERLSHSEERYRTLARVSPVGLFRTGPDGNYNYVNEHTALITGLGPEALEGRGWLAALHVEDRERVRTDWDRAVSLNEPFHAEYRFVRPDGRLVWVLGRALADRGPDGGIIGYVGTLTDITERKQAETLLACQKKTLSLIACGSPVAEVLDALLRQVRWESPGLAGAAFLMDAKGDALELASAPGMPESMRRSLASLPPSEESGPAGVAAATRRLAGCPRIEDGGSWTRGRAESLAEGFLSCYAMPIKGSYGGTLGAVAFWFRRADEPSAFDTKLLETASDLAAITVERRHQEEIARINQELSEDNRRIMEANRMKSEFMASMSHELRTPLNAIIGFSQLLIDRKVGPLNEKQAEYLGDVLEGGMHLLRLINDVLDLAKIESGKMQLYRETVDIPSAVREVCDILLPMALAKGIDLRTDAALSPPASSLDSQKFKQVLYNLVSNAIKFSSHGGAVLVAADRKDGNLRLRVTDHGIGIRKEDLGRLFQEFQQLESGAARHLPGTGLGLVITKKLVELHGGSVGVESEPGKGSTFQAIFPETSGSGA
jgi:PAS domain S-box-containing protein